MGKVTGFLEYPRHEPGVKPPQVRKKDFKEFVQPLRPKEVKEQAARCMDCGTPFCHIGCPLGNIIPDFNHYVYTGNYLRAYEILRDTNNFPSVTGRVCPAPCESSCVLAINKPAVTIKNVENFLGDIARKEKWDSGKRPSPAVRTEKTLAIVGSGPAGLAAADQLNQAGHTVEVFERSNRIGGLLVYGIPNFKLDKTLIEHEVSRLEKEGVRFTPNCEIGKDISLDTLQKKHDAVVLCIGSTLPRDLPIKNRDAEGILFAMDFLTDATRNLLDKTYNARYTAKDKHVLVIGGGDTGSDCIGTSFRQKAKSVTQIELLPKPPAERDESMPWPQYDRVFRISSSQAEGAHRQFSILTKEFSSNAKNQVTGIVYNTLEWSPDKKQFKESQKKPQTLKADLILLAMGFTAPDVKTVEKDSKHSLTTHPRGTLETASAQSFKTNLSNVFVAGDARRGQSLVVWAISEGRECAREVDTFLRQTPSKLVAKNYSLSNSQAFNGSAQPENYEIF